MNRCAAAILILGTVALLGSTAQAQETMDLDAALQYLPTYQLGQSRAPLSVVDDATRDPQQREALEAHFVALLQDSATSAGAKRFICRKLGVMGTAASIPALLGLIEDAQVGSAAVRALGGIPAPEADAALVQVVDRLPGHDKIAAINCLGPRKQYEALAALLGSSDPGVAEAAAYALGVCADKQASRIAAEKRKSAQNGLRAALTDACLRCAAANQDVALYESLMAKGEASHVRTAALKGLIQAEPGKALERVRLALEDSDPGLALTALAFVRTLPGTDATRSFAAELDRASPRGQVLLLDALADRGDAAAGPAVKRVAQSDEPEVRLAAVRALGRLGDGSSAQMLAEAAASSRAKKELAELFRAARESLNTLPGEGVDDVLLGIARQGEGKVRTEAIRALGERLAYATKKPLLALASDSDEKVRGASLKALAILAAEEDIPALLALLEKTAEQGDREDIEKAIVTIAERVVDEQQRTAALIQALEQARKPEYKASLVNILGLIANGPAFDAVRAALEDADPQVQGVALSRLARWPNDAPLDDLERLAKAAPSEEVRAQAMEGYIRVLREAKSRSVAERAQRYTDVLKMAANENEKKGLLGGLAELPSPAALELVEASRGDKAVAAEASFAIVRIAQSICGAYPEKAGAAVKPFLDPAADETLRKQAQQVMATIAGFQGYITAWELSGPYFEEGKSGSMLFDSVFPPEKPDAVVTDWRIAPMGLYRNMPFAVNLDKALGGYERVAYLRTMLASPKAQQAVLELGTNDGVKVWLNGDRIHEFGSGRALQCGEDKIPVQLKEGNNTLLLAVYQQGGEWGACARLVASDGQPLEGVRAKVE